MFKEEAEFIGTILDGFSDDELDPVLEIGASTLSFRVSVKPHINENIHSKLFARGIRVIHSDFKPDPDIANPEDQIIGDVFDEKIFKRMLDTKPKCILLCNILEHVKNPKELCERIMEISNEKTIIIVTVPFSFPYHRDPIDTLFRPSPEELIKNFNDVEVIHKEIIEGSNFGEHLKKLNHAAAFIRLTKEILKIFIHLVTFQIKRIKFSRILWLRKNYAVSLVVLKKIN